MTLDIRFSFTLDRRMRAYYRNNPDLFRQSIRDFLTGEFRDSGQVTGISISESNHNQHTNKHTPK